MILATRFCIFTAEGLDEDGPYGECHDLGDVSAGEVLAALAKGEAIRQREGWPGRVYLQDHEGNPVDWRALAECN